MEEILAPMISLAPFMMIIAIVWISSQRKLEEKRLDATAMHAAGEAAREYTADKEIAR